MKEDEMIEKLEELANYKRGKTNNEVDNFEKCHPDLQHAAGDYEPLPVETKLPDSNGNIDKHHEIIMEEMERADEIDELRASFGASKLDQH